MRWLKKLLARFRRAPRLVVEFRRNKEETGVNVRVSAVGTEHAHEYERRMMAVFLLALEHGAFALSREKSVGGFRCEGMDGLWQKAIVLGWLILHEEELKP